MSFSPFRCLAGNALSWTSWEVCQKYLFLVQGYFREELTANFSPFPREHVCVVHGDGPRCLFIKQKQGAVSGLNVRVLLYLCCGLCWGTVLSQMELIQCPVSLTGGDLNRKGHQRIKIKDHLSDIYFSEGPLRQFIACLQSPGVFFQQNLGVWINFKAS